MIYWKDTISIIIRLFEINNKDVAEQLGVTASTLSKVKSGEINAPVQFTSGVVYSKIFDPAAKISPVSNDDRDLLSTLKQIIENDFPNVWESMSDYWNENDYKTFVITLLNRTKNKKLKGRSKHSDKHDGGHYPSHCNSIEAVFNFFNQAILDYRIKLFVESIDPTSIMDIDYIEKCDSFIKHIKDDSWVPSTAAAIKETQVVVHKIYQFCKILDEYTTYLGCHMRPVDQVQAPATFVPIYREENIQWALDFEKQVQDYRNQLIIIYQEICTNIIVSQNPVFSTV